MFYYNNFWGMDFVWWCIWIIVLFWIFFTPYDIPGQRNKKDSPLGILQKRFAAGEITIKEYEDKKQTLIKDLAT